MAGKSKRTYFSMVPNRALDLGLTDSTLAVLLLLASYLDGEGWSRATVAEMARSRGVSRQALLKHLAALEGAGLIEGERCTRLDGGKGSTRYCIIYDLKKAPETATHATPEVAYHATEGATQDATPEVASTPSYANSKTQEVVTRERAESPVPRLVALYVDNSPIAPTDAGRLGAQIKRHLAAGATEADLEQAVVGCALDPFGASALSKHLRLIAGSPPPEPAGFAGIRAYMANR